MGHPERNPSGTYHSPQGEERSMSETYTTKEAADVLGVDVARFFRLMDTHTILPVLSAPGIRGAKFWDVEQINDLAAELAAA
jgi:hypothetical protein